MIRIFLPGQVVPTWLQRVEPDHIKVMFGSVVYVYKYKGIYYVNRLISIGCVFFIDSGEETFTLTGQGESVHINMRPLISDFYLLCAGITGWFLLLGDMLGCS